MNASALREPSLGSFSVLGGEVVIPTTRGLVRILFCLSIVLVFRLTSFGNDTSLSDTITALKDCESAVPDFRVVLEVNTSQSSKHARAPLPLRETAHYSIAAHAGMIRYESDGTRLSDVLPPSTYRHRLVGVFNGNNVQVMSSVGKAVDGIVSHDLTWLRMNVDPRDLLTSYKARAVSSYIDKYGATIIGTATWDSRDVLTLETRPVSGRGCLWKMRFLLAPVLGFYPVRKAQLVKGEKEGDWYEYSFAESTAFARTNDGAWFPTHAVVEDRSAPSEASKSVLLFRHEITARDWQPLTAIPATEFQMSFPPGTYVQDDVLGTRYVAVRTSDQMLADQAAAAAALRGKQTYAVPLMVIGVIGICIVLFVVARRHTRARTEQSL